MNIRARHRSNWASRCRHWTLLSLDESFAQAVLIATARGPKGTPLRAVCTNLSANSGPLQCQGQASSDGAFMDIAPVLARARLQRDGDGMVGLLIVRLGVLVGGVVGAGHPAAGQAQPQRHPAASAITAFQALGRVWPDRAGGGEMLARPGAVKVAPRLGWSWHRVPVRRCYRGMPSQVKPCQSSGEMGKMSSAHQVA
jgi:hypothetical protein